MCSNEGMPYHRSKSDGTLAHIKFLKEMKSYLKNRVGQKVNLGEIPGFYHQVETNPFIPNDYQYLANQLVSSDVNNYLANLAAISCSQSDRVDLSKVQVLRKFNPRSIFRGKNRKNNYKIHEKKWFSKIDEVLETGKPVGFSYNVAHFLWIIRNEFQPHASTITARKWESGQCLYKVRNSWGSSCGSYDFNIRLRCDEEEGAFWLTRDELLESGRYITYINRRL